MNNIDFLVSFDCVCGVSLRGWICFGKKTEVSFHCRTCGRVYSGEMGLHIADVNKKYD